MIREAYDDFFRFLRDRKANSQVYDVLTVSGLHKAKSSSLAVGDVLQLKSGDRVPADLLLIHTDDPKGSMFIKTDQLDGETDWKTRKAVNCTQRLDPVRLWDFQAEFTVEPPHADIYEFKGNVSLPSGEVEGLSLDNTLWSNCVVASGSILAIVMYTGSDTKSVLNANEPCSKLALSDVELNRLGKLLFLMTFVLSGVMIICKGLQGPWYLYFIRFILLFSSLIPISLRVNLDLAKTLYSILMMRDTKIPGTVVRSSTIPEDLGRLSYLLSDKTGTLTRNVMNFKKLQLQPPFLYTEDQIDDIKEKLSQAFDLEDQKMQEIDPVHELKQAVLALALTHCVSPVIEDQQKTFQASSPDEVALVRFCERIGLSLESRDDSSITLKTVSGKLLVYQILEIFPFTSASKRMGIVLKDSANVIHFYVKGAETAISTMIESSEWMDEEVETMASEGLRTLVFAHREVSPSDYESFRLRYHRAKSLLQNRETQVLAAQASLEKEMELIGVSGVEDRLQEGVRECLETLRFAGLRVWMLTGDKVETAKCIARSARLVDRFQEMFTISGDDKERVVHALDQFGTKRDCALVIDGKALEICLEYYESEFFAKACEAPALICCRCSPQQKADIVALAKRYSGKLVAAVGDGGNDVSMIQTANIGLGIVGKEGNQASLAADFSVNEFRYIERLLLWHGRNSYQRSARLSQFIMYRGAVIAVIQAVFSSLFFFAPLPIYTGWVAVGYSTFYTSLPVFSLVIDQDVTEKKVYEFPKLYEELQKGRSLSFKTFFIWMLQSVYQGGAIMIASLVLFDNEFINIIAITFTALIFCEFLSITLEVHWSILDRRSTMLILFSILLSLMLYASSLFLLRDSFDVSFIRSSTFFIKVSIVTIISVLPVSLTKIIAGRLAPTVASKVDDSSWQFLQQWKV